MKKIEILARTTKQALEKAAERLDVKADELTILEEYDPDENDLITLEKEEAEHPEYVIEGEPGLFVISASNDKAFTAIREWLEGLVERFQEGSRIELIPEEDSIIAVVHAEDPSIWIGRQGQTLNALQHVVSRVLPQLIEDCPIVHLDVGDYREKRMEKLEEMADFAVRRAKKSRRAFKMKPMGSQDRKYIHHYLKDEEGIGTTSMGNDPERYIVIELPGEKDRGHGQSEGGRGGNDKRGRDRNGSRNNNSRGRGGNDNRGRDNGARKGDVDGNRADPNDENQNYYYKSEPIEQPKRKTLDELLGQYDDDDENTSDQQNDDQEELEFDSRKPKASNEDDYDENQNDSNDGLVDELED